MKERKRGEVGDIYRREIGLAQGLCASAFAGNRLGSRQLSQHLCASHRTPNQCMTPTWETK